MTEDLDTDRPGIMPSGASSNAVFVSLDVERHSRGRLRGARLYRAFLRSIPALWIIGVLTPAGALLLIKLAAERWPRGPLINLVIWSWFAIGLSQSAAAILNGIAIGDYGKGFANAVSFGAVGWIFGGLAIAAGAAHRLDGPPLIRATTWVGGYIIILAALAGVFCALGRRELYVWTTPASMVLPSSPSVMFYTMALVYQTEETLGEATTRLVLFFPWATGLGLGGLAIAFISTLDRNLWWRFIGLGGGIIGVVFSWSRIAIASLFVVACLLVFARLPMLYRLAVIGVVLIALITFLLNGNNPFEQIGEISNLVNGARAGSSLARELIYEQSWQGFLHCNHRSSDMAGSVSPCI
jgi:hypothetical protein